MNENTDLAKKFSARPDLSSKLLLLFTLCCAFAYCVFLQFLTPAFYESDSYYHIAVSRFIKDFGFHYNFHWAKFSVYQDFFSDKDFLFHLLIVPFLGFTKDMVVAGKYAVIFYDLLFILAFLYILRKYLPDYLVSCFLLLPFMSASFTIYFLFLRSFTLANILTILGIYFLIKKRILGVFFATFFYALSHTSFFTIIFFAFVCEIIRWFFNRDLFRRNIYAAVIGALAGCLIHPNFPNNLLYVHLQFLAVNYANKGWDLGLGSELFTFPTKIAFLSNFAVFVSLNSVFWISWFSRARISFATAVWAACANVYFLLALTSDRHWYPVNILAAIACASYLKDWLGARQWKDVTRKMYFAFLLYALTIFLYFPFVIGRLSDNIYYASTKANHYEAAGRWMKENIPSGELIYHSYWSDPAYFLCFNPGNDYLVVLDPLYMYHRYPQLYLFYQKLSRGQVNNVYAALKNVFGVNYGYTRKDNLVYDKIKEDPAHFRIIFEDDAGIVFSLVRP